MEASLVFPHQLFENNPCISLDKEVYIIEELLFFKQYKFHKIKLYYHRTTMKFYENYLKKQGISVHYIDANSRFSDIRILGNLLKEKGITKIHICDLTDNWLEKRLRATGIEIKIYTTPMFLNSQEDLRTYFSDKKRMFQTDFYIEQRKRRNILLDENKKPLGGKWSWDAENRKKYPKGKLAPGLPKLIKNKFDIEAENFVHTHFQANYGILGYKYPSTFQEAKNWLKEFIENRLFEFGAYEDAIVSEESILHHSVLTPMLNNGLLTPQYVLNETLRFTSDNEIPISSLEGFIRQIIGWREFIRAVYILKGQEERTKNFWNFDRSVPSSFYSGTTGILPIDLTIKKVLHTAYNHHIERLMILGNFMLLCEFKPNDVYRWFMEMYIDAYDWVMVPNVYGMSQFADGGLMATKPYISGSNYILKMSNFPKGNWTEIWDALFWTFMDKQRSFFLSHPRIGMLVRALDKMAKEKIIHFHAIAHKFLNPQT